MTRDIQERLELFGAIVEVERLALNWDQIELYQPPENPAKLTDSRSESYVDKYGESSYELDALEPNVIESLIRDAIHRLTDHDLLIARTEKQDEDKEKLIRGIIRESNKDQRDLIEKYETMTKVTR